MEDNSISIKKLISEVKNLTNLDSESRQFIKWYETSKMIIKKMFGEDSSEYKDFSGISFSPWSILDDYDVVQEAQVDFKKGLEKACIMLEVIESQIKITGNKDIKSEKVIDKIFISHSSKDKDYVDLIVEMLNFIGVEKSAQRIFYSSKEGYGVPLAENIYDYLKDQLNNDIMVLFILSDNYYSSVPCLNEMGATWVTSKEYYSILLPFFEFRSIKGAIDPQKISFSIENKHKLSEFKNKIIDIFKLSKIEERIWEDYRDNFLDKMNNLKERDKYKNQKCKVEVAKVKASGKDEIQVELRFINNGEEPIEFTEIEIILTDIDKQAYRFYVDEAFLNGKIIYKMENRREIYTTKLLDTRYNPKRQNGYETNSYHQNAY